MYASFASLIQKNIFNRMAQKMAPIAILYLLLLERFLASDMDEFTEPVLRGMRALEKSALRYAQKVIPGGLMRPPREKRLSKYFLYSRQISSDGVFLDLNDKTSFLHFHPEKETKVIIHGFLDKVKIADWMHDMKDELLLFGDYNVIIVDWSLGNFIPYTKAAANTEQVGEEIADLVLRLMELFGVMPEKFHLIGHSLGSHVAGHVGERVKGIKRITGLDPATYLFSDKSASTRLDRTDAVFVDVIHTDAGGIGMVETVGHVDFYPNGGEVQTGCTASNSLRSLLEKGVVEGVRNVICSHMRAPLLFTETINARHCHMIGYKCTDYKSFLNGSCNTCLREEECPVMGLHVDSQKDYGNGTKYYLITTASVPYCGFEYKLVLERADKVSGSRMTEVFKRSEWSSSDILQVSLYGSSGSAEFTIEGKDEPFGLSHVVLSPLDLGNVHGAIIQWSKKPITRRRGMVNMISNAIRSDSPKPAILKIGVVPMTSLRWRNIPSDLCISPLLASEDPAKRITFREDYC